MLPFGTMVDNSMRLDKWLWAARWFKTRKLACAAITGGKVHLNGARAKASREVKPGDELQITKDIYRYTIIIEGVCATRRPYAEAKLLYTETEASQAANKLLAETRRAMPHAPKNKPTKRERGQIIRFKRDLGDD